MQVQRWRGSRALSILVVCSVFHWSCGEKRAPVEVIDPPAPTVASVAVTSGMNTLIVGQTTEFSAVAHDAGGHVVPNTPVSWSAIHPSIATISGGADSADITVIAVTPGVATFTATAAGKSASRIVTVTAPPLLDMQIVDAQWTQGVQQSDGAIPMVLNGNAAVLNVLVSASEGGAVGGQLVLTATANNGAVIHTDTAVLRTIGRQTPTFAAPTAQFLVPSSILRSGMQWQLVRDPKHLVPDSDLANDRFPRSAAATLATVTLPPLRLKFVPIVLNAHGNATGNVASDNVTDYLPTVLRVVPVGAWETTIGSPLATTATFGTPPSGGAETFWLQVLAELDLARVADIASSGTYWVGVVRPPSGFTNTAFGGFSYIPSVPTTSGPGNRTTVLVQTGWFNNTGQTADLVAHELGHAFGRRHSPCGGPSGVDPSYPTVNGSIGVAGHDVRSWALGQANSAAVRAAATGDVMGYCFPQWSSPYTYSEMLLSRQLSAPIIANPTQSRTASVSALSHRKPESVVVVRGHMNSGRITLLPTVTMTGYPTESFADSPALFDVRGQLGGPSGNPPRVRIELLDEHHRLIAAQQTDLRTLDHSPLLTFIAALPMSERDASRVSTVRVTSSIGGFAQRRSVVSVSNGNGSNAGSNGTASARSAVALVHMTTSDLASVRCLDNRMIAMVVQDHESGAVLASSPTTHVSIRAQTSAMIDITCSDGVRSARHLGVRLGQRLP